MEQRERGLLEAEPGSLVEDSAQLQKDWELFMDLHDQLQRELERLEAFNTMLTDADSDRLREIAETEKPVSQWNKTEVWSVCRLLATDHDLAAPTRTLFREIIQEARQRKGRKIKYAPELVALLLDVLFPAVQRLVADKDGISVHAVTSKAVAQYIAFEAPPNRSKNQYNKERRAKKIENLFKTLRDARDRELNKAKS